MPPELAAPTWALLNEIRNPASTPESVAKTYRLAMESSRKTVWRAVNEAITYRWSRTTLEKIKSMAHGRER